MFLNGIFKFVYKVFLVKTLSYTLWWFSDVTFFDNGSVTLITGTRKLFKKMKPENEHKKVF